MCALHWATELIIVIALDEMHSSAVLRLFFFCQVAVGVDESDVRDESAPAQTSPQQAGLGSDRPSACWRSVLVVVFVQQMSTKFHSAQIFVIAKFDVILTNTIIINIQSLSLFILSSGGWVKIKLLSSHTSTYQIHVVFRFNRCPSLTCCANCQAICQALQRATGSQG